MYLLQNKQLLVIVNALDNGLYKTIFMLPAVGGLHSIVASHSCTANLWATKKHRYRCFNYAEYCNAVQECDATMLPLLMLLAS
jgi:hypothetical protein